MKSPASLRRFARLFMAIGAIAIARADDPVALEPGTVVSVLNRSAVVKADGTWRIDNVPANFGPVRIRATSVKDGITRSAQSDFVRIEPNAFNGVGEFTFGNPAPIPAKLQLGSSVAKLTSPGATVQIAVTAVFPDATTTNVSAASAGTSYTISNPLVATIDQTGLVTAVASGTVLVSALNDGAVGVIRLQVEFSNTDADGDGLTDEVELANGMNPGDPVDAFEDPDRDGLTNLEELTVNGTNRLIGDTDGDGLNDGDEVHGKFGKVTNPLLKDTDGDLINDALEFEAATDPTSNASFNFGAALQSLAVSPNSFVLTVDALEAQASRQLTVTGVLRDGTSVDLTSTARGTNYASSGLLIVNFGAPDGNVFAGNNGTATVTVTNGAFSATAAITVQSSSLNGLGSVAIPGFANNVDVSGNYAYVAAGSAGLQVVDVSVKSNPQVVAALDTPGTAIDVRVVGSRAYVADGESGLQIISVANPLAPVLVGSVDTPGRAYDLAVAGNICYVADGSGGLQVVSVANPAVPVIISTFATTAEAYGVAVSGTTAVLAEGGTGIQVMDVSIPAAVESLATLNINGGTCWDVELQGAHAYVAGSYGTSLSVVNLQDPAHPQLLASTPPDTGGYLWDVALDANFVFGADKYFANLGVPIIDVQTPATPTPRAILTFAGGQPFGTGIAVDGRFAYLTADPGYQLFEKGGVTGDSRLYIGQYLSLSDDAGIAPTVLISAPATGVQLVENQTIVLRAEATDDVGVAGVAFYVNGTLVGSDALAPFEFIYTVPAVATQLILTATAVDYGNNSATSEAVFVEIVPDPLTAVSGRLVDASGQPVLGANVSVFGLYATVSSVDGAFQISNLPTILGKIIVNAQSDTLVGRSAARPPVPGGIIEMGDITLRPGVRIISPVDGASVVEGETILVEAVDQAGSNVASIELQADGVPVGTAYYAPYQFYYTVPMVLGPVSLTVSSTDVNGLVTVGATTVIQVTSDPGTTATGRVMDMSGRPVAGATVSAPGAAPVQSDATGNFVLPGVSTAQGDITVTAQSDDLRGSSSSFPPVRGGTVDVGTIPMTPRSYFVNLPSYAGSVALEGDYAYLTLGTGLGVVDVSDRRNPVIVATLEMPNSPARVRAAGNLAFLADTTGVQIISIADPLHPAVIGHVAIPDGANDVTLAGRLCYVAGAGHAGLQVVDITDPTAPAVIARYDSASTYIGGIALSGTRALLSLPGYGLEIVNLSDPFNIQHLGTYRTFGGGYNSVAGLEGNYAYVTEPFSFSVIDLSDPTQPQEVYRQNIFYYPGGIVIDRHIAYVATGWGGPESVARFSLVSPASPTELPPLDLRPSSSGHRLVVNDVVVDGRYLYAVTMNNNGDSGADMPRLFITKYFDPRDDLGVAPVVAVIEPVDASFAVQGTQVSVTVSATDDVAVGEVQLYADGMLVGTKTVAPYTFFFTAPPLPGQVALTARATDFGGNSATSVPVTMSVIADPGTTVRGRLLDPNGQPYAGVRVEVFGEYSAYSDAAGYFEITSVPTTRGSFVVTATLGGVFGESARFLPIVNGIVNVGTINAADYTPTMVITKRLGNSQVIQGERITVNVTDGSYSGGAPFVEVFGNGVHVASSDSLDAPSLASFYIPEITGPFAVTATVSYSNGRAFSTVAAQLTVISDPGITVTGRVVASSGQPVAGAKAEVFGAKHLLDDYSPWQGAVPPEVPPIGAVSALTDANGQFSLSGVSTVRGDLVVVADFTDGEGNRLFGFSPRVAATGGGAADVGAVTIKPESTEIRINLPVGGGLISQGSYFFFEVPFADFGAFVRFQLFGNGSLIYEIPHYQWETYPFIATLDAPQEPGLLVVQAMVAYNNGGVATSTERLIQVMRPLTTRVTGRVVDESGHPMRRATIDLNGVKVLSDHNGYFRAAGVPYYPAEGTAGEIYVAAFLRLPGFDADHYGGRTVTPSGETVDAGTIALVYIPPG